MSKEFSSSLNILHCNAECVYNKKLPVIEIFHANQIDEAPDQPKIKPPNAINSHHP